MLMGNGMRDESYLQVGEPALPKAIYLRAAKIMREQASHRVKAEERQRVVFLCLSVHIPGHTECRETSTSDAHCQQHDGRINAHSDHTGERLYFQMLIFYTTRIPLECINKILYTLV